MLHGRHRNAEVERPCFSFQGRFREATYVLGGQVETHNLKSVSCVLSYTFFVTAIRFIPISNKLPRKISHSSNSSGNPTTSCLISSDHRICPFQGRASTYFTFLHLFFLSSCFFCYMAGVVAYIRSSVFIRLSSLMQESL